MTRARGTAARPSGSSSAAIALDDLPPEVRKQLEKRTGKKLRAPRQQWPMDEVRRYAIRVLTVVADLTPSQRRRVLAHAGRMNDV